MNIAKLRSRLVLASPDLQTLTSTDLENCLWSTKQRLVLALFQETSLLEEESNKLSELLEEKSASLANWRRTNTAKEVKLRYEHQFRNDFLRVMLTGLEKMRWPPTLEAFTNPLPGLQDDKSFFLEAIDYVVSIVHPHMATPRVDRPPSASGRSAPPSSSKQRPLETHFGSFETSRTPPQHLSSPQAQELPQPPAESASAASAEANDSLLSPPRRPISERDNRLGRREQGPDACILSLLQMQNDQLRTRLARAEDAILRRDQAEQTVGLLLRDFLSAASELASAGEEGNEEAGRGAAVAPAAGRTLRMTMRKLHTSLTQLDRQWREARKDASRSATEARSTGGTSDAAGSIFGRLDRLTLSAPDVAHGDRAGAEAFALQRDLVRWADAALLALDSGIEPCGRLAGAVPASGVVALADLHSAASDLSLRLARCGALTDEETAQPALARLSQAVAALPRSAAAVALRDEVEEVRRSQATQWRDRVRSRRLVAQHVQLSRRLASQLDDVCGRLPALVCEARSEVERSVLAAGEGIMRGARRGRGMQASSDGDSEAALSSNIAETFRALEDALVQSLGALRTTTGELRLAAEAGEQWGRENGPSREEIVSPRQSVASQSTRSRRKSSDQRLPSRRTAEPLSSRPPFDLSLS